MSRDGVRWDRVDMNGIGVDQYTNIAGVIGAGPDHVTVIVQRNRLVAYTSAVADLQVTEPERRPGEPDVMVVEWGADLKLGQRYGYPLFTHCGIEWLGEFNGNTWKLDQSEPHDEEAGGGGMIYGYVLLTADDRIEYSDAEGTLGRLPPDNRAAVPMRVIRPAPKMMLTARLRSLSAEARPDHAPRQRFLHRSDGTCLTDEPHE